MYADGFFSGLVCSPVRTDAMKLKTIHIIRVQNFILYSKFIVIWNKTEVRALYIVFSGLPHNA
jgi:hypothetical protein